MNSDDTQAPPGVTLRDPEDMPTWRHAIFDGVKNSLESVFPQSYGGVQLHVKDLHYADPEHYDLATQKHALLHDKYLSRRLKGTVTLVDDVSGKPIEEKTLTLMRVPYLTERGTFLHNGSEYTSSAQLRLLPGAYTRRQESGELETQFNVRSGTGNAFRVGFEPESAQYKLKIQQANLHLYSLLHDIGIPDEKLEKSWGKDILELNRRKYDSRVFDKAYERLVMKNNKKPEHTREDKARLIREALDASMINKRVAQANLPSMFSMEKSAAWLKEAAEDEVKNKEIAFNPTLDHDDVVYTNEGERWSALHQPYHNDASWLRWYAGYCDGKRSGVDEFQKNRWKRFYRLNVPRFKESPTVPRGLALQGWAIDPLSLLSGEKLTAFEEQWHGHSKKASAEPVEVVPPEPRGLMFLEKAARYGAGVIFKLPNGKYLLEKNHPDKGMPPEVVGKLRPAGGGKSKSDANLRQTILREMEEEFGIDPEDAKDKIRLLGYIPSGKFKDCALFEMEDHDLKPGKYQASNSKSEYVELVEAGLDHPDYIGEHPKNLRMYHRENYKPDVKYGEWEPWIGYDLDRTLAHREEGDPLDTIGEPIERMIRHMLRNHRKGETVKIFTARAGDATQRSLIKRWLAKHQLPDLEITDRKDPGCRAIYDDIAHNVQANEGKITKAASAGKFRMPENYSEVDFGKNWTLYAGANDWEL